MGGKKDNVKGRVKMLRGEKQEHSRNDGKMEERDIQNTQEMEGEAKRWEVGF